MLERDERRLCMELERDGDLYDVDRELSIIEAVGFFFEKELDVAARTVRDLRHCNNIGKDFEEIWKDWRGLREKEET